jgi:hypothetical protein
MSDYKSVENGYDFESFIRDYKRIHNVETVDYRAVLEHYFDGDIDEYVTDTEFRAFDAQLTENEQRRRDDACRAITAITLAASRYPVVVRNILHAFLGNSSAEPFLSDLGKALDGETRDLLRLASRDASIPEPERRAIACLAEVDIDGLVSGTARFGDENTAQSAVRENAESDFPGRIFGELRKGAFPATDRRLTVSEARRRVAKHTGQSQRAVIRQTTGWDADEVIRLIA